MLIKLEPPPIFLGYLDEEFFYAWLKSIRGIDAFQSRADKLEIAIRDDVSEHELTELIALLVRYDLDVACLQPLAVGTRGRWLKRVGRMFGTKRGLSPGGGRKRRGAASAIVHSRRLRSSPTPV